VRSRETGIRVVVQEAPEPSTGGEDFYGPIMGARRGAGITRWDTSDSSMCKQTGKDLVEAQPLRVRARLIGSLVGGTKLAEFVAKCERAGIRVVVQEAPEPSTGGEDFYGRLRRLLYDDANAGALALGDELGQLGTFFRFRGTITRSPTSDPISLARTRSG
jgi:hypothetical protein